MAMHSRLHAESPKQQPRGENHACARVCVCVCVCLHVCEREGEREGEGNSTSQWQTFGLGKNGPCQGYHSFWDHDGESALCAAQEGLRRNFLQHCNKLLVDT